MKTLWVICNLVFTFDSCKGNTPPYFTGTFSVWTVSEAAAPGTTVYQLKASDQESEVYYGIEGTDYFAVNEFTGVVTVKRSLDYETIPYHSFLVTLADLLLDGSINPVFVRQNVSVAVTDVNDNLPQFALKSPLHLPLPVSPESPLLMTNVTDADHVGDPLSVTCFELPDHIFASCNYLEIRNLDGSVQQATISVYVRSEFFDENKTSLRFALKTFDGQFSTVLEVTTEPTTKNSYASAESDKHFDGPQFNSDFIILEVSETVYSGYALQFAPRLFVFYENDNFADVPINITLQQISPIAGFENAFEVSPEQVYGSSQLDIKVLNASILDIDLNKNLAVQLEVVAKETFSEKPASVLPITLMPKDENDNLPLFSQNSYNFPLVYYTGTAIEVGQVYLTDADVSDKYGIESVVVSLKGNCEDCFAIEIINHGQYRVFTKECRLAVECFGSDSVMLFVTATDNNGQGHTRQAVLYFSKPLRHGQDTFGFAKPILEASISESSAYFTRLPNLEAARTFNLSLNDPKDVFGIDDQSGILYVKRPNRVMRNILGDQHNVTLKMHGDDQAIVSATVIITVEAQQHPNREPTFVNDSYLFTLPTGSQKGFVIGNIVAIDSDSNDALTYGVLSDKYNLFNIHAETGVITYTGKRLPNKRKIAFSAFVSDNGSPNRPSSTMIDVIIEKSSSTNPKLVFPKEKAISVSLDFGSADGRILLSHIVIADPDAQELSVKITNITTFGKTPTEDLNLHNFVDILPADHCDVCPDNLTSGQIAYSVYLTDVSALKEVFSLRIKLEVADLTHLEEEPAEVVILVNRQHRKPLSGTSATSLSFIPPGPYEITVPESNTAGSYILNVAVVTDSKDAVIVYSFSDPTSYFDINRNTGVITLKHGLDYEFIQRHVFTVKATNQRNGDYVEMEVNVNVMNTNDNIPKFHETSYRFSVVENAETGTEVKLLKAEDRDGGSLFYRLDGNHSELFAISPEGRITVNGLLDREKLHSFTMLAVASDNLTENTVREASVPVYVTLLDENDNSPHFTQPIYSATITENSPPHIRILQLTATDPDLGPNGALEFSLHGLDQALQGKIVVNPATGAVQIAESLEGQARFDPYDFFAMVQDGGGRNVSVPVKVAIQAASKCAPILVLPLPNATVFEIAEDSPVGTRIADFRAHTMSQECTDEYILLEESDPLSRTVFDLNPRTGELTLSDQLDYETHVSYPLLVGVRSSDAGGTFTAQMRVEVRVINVDDNAPIFYMPTANFSACDGSMPECGQEQTDIFFLVLEEEPVGSSVGQLKAMDSDHDPYLNRNQLRFQISGEDSDYFDIDVQTGILSVKQPLDRELKSTYKLEAMVTSSNDRKAQASVEVTVMDSNDNPPVFSEQINYFAVPHKAQLGIIISNLVAVDNDSLTSTGDIHCQLASSRYYFKGVENVPTEAPFYVNETDHTLRTNKTMATYANVFFNLTITAYDASNRNLSNDMTILIWVYTPEQLIRIDLVESPDTFIRNMPASINDISESMNAIVIIDRLHYLYDKAEKINNDQIIVEAIFIDRKSNAIMEANAVSYLMNKQKPSMPIAFKDVHSAATVEHISRGLSIAAIGLIFLIAVLFFGLLAFVCFVCYLRYTFLEDKHTANVKHSVEMNKPATVKPSQSLTPLTPPPPKPAPLVYQSQYGSVTLNPLCPDAFDPSCAVRQCANGKANDSPVISVEVPDYTKEKHQSGKRKRDALYETLNR